MLLLVVVLQQLEAVLFSSASTMGSLIWGVPHFGHTLHGQMRMGMYNTAIATCGRRLSPERINRFCTDRCSVNGGSTYHSQLATYDI